MPKPILKWAGGKRQLLPEIMKRMPESFKGYWEPFLGGGALFFELHNRKTISSGFLSDLNVDLISVYKYIRNEPQELIESINNLNYGNNENDYYAARKEFNSKPEPLRRAALMIYLNRHCFNGLYRVSSSGNFNVPFGRYKNPRIPDQDDILSMSEALKNVELECCDFEPALKNVEKNDFVYLDPPYHPLSKTAFFTSYNSGSFGPAEQERLFSVFENVSSRGAFVVMSNSDSQLIRELYSSYHIFEITANRSINSDKSGRKGITELIITN